MKNTSKLAVISAFILALNVTSTAFGESTGQYIDDAAITTKVKAALLADKNLKSTHISVETNRGTVELSGTVDTMDEESMAVKDANQIKGVRAVKDLLVVKGMEDQIK